MEINYFTFIRESFFTGVHCRGNQSLRKLSICNSGILDIKGGHIGL